MTRVRLLRRWFGRKFGYARLICLVLLVGLAALRIADPAPIEEIRLRTFDTFQRIDYRVKTVKPVTIVDIDEKSLAKLGQWPWPRTRIADLVTNLTRLGAVVIAFDIIFAEPDRLNPDSAADTFRNLDEETKAKLRALPSNDQIFADAMRHSRVVMGESGLPEVLSEFDKTLPVTGLAMLGEDPQRFMFSFPGLLRNTQVLETAAGVRRPRPPNDQSRTRRNRPAGADDHAGAGRYHAFTELRNAATGDRHRYHLHQIRCGGHQERSGKGFRSPDRPQWPALGSFCALRSFHLCLGCRRA